MGKHAVLVLAGVACLGTLAGCMDSLAKQSQKTGSIIGKKTDKIEQFDPNKPQLVSDSKVRADDPVLYPLQAYGPIVEQISKLNIDHAVRLYEAQEGHYPRSHEEFMTGVVKANQIQLPVLPGGWKYAYDVENHKLEVVRPPDLPAKAGGQAPAANPAGNAADAAAKAGR
jgi:hypothetical protein